jgi:hypothetical protein
LAAPAASFYLCSLLLLSLSLARSSPFSPDLARPTHHDQDQPIPATTIPVGRILYSALSLSLSFFLLSQRQPVDTMGYSGGKNDNIITFLNLLNYKLSIFFSLDNCDMSVSRQFCHYPTLPFTNRFTERERERSGERTLERCSGGH